MMVAEGCVAARDAAVVRVRGDFYCRDERFPSIYIVCFVLKVGVQFLSLYIVIW